MHSSEIFALVSSIVAIVYGIFLITSIMKKPAGNDKMKEIAAGWKDSESVTCDTPDLAIVELTVPTKFKVVPIDTRVPNEHDVLRWAGYDRHCDDDFVELLLKRPDPREVHKHSAASTIELRRTR